MELYTTVCLTTKVALLYCAGMDGTVLCKLVGELGPSTLLVHYCLL